MKRVAFFVPYKNVEVRGKGVGTGASVLIHHSLLQDTSTSAEVLQYFCGRITVLLKKY